MARQDKDDAAQPVERPRAAGSAWFCLRLMPSRAALTLQGANPGPAGIYLLLDLSLQAAIFRQPACGDEAQLSLSPQVADPKCQVPPVTMQCMIRASHLRAPSNFVFVCRYPTSCEMWAVRLDKHVGNGRGRMYACETFQPLRAENTVVTPTWAQAQQAVRPPKELSSCHSLLASAAYCTSVSLPTMRTSSLCPLSMSGRRPLPDLLHASWHNVVGS